MYFSLMAMEGQNVKSKYDNSGSNTPHELWSPCVCVCGGGGGLRQRQERERERERDSLCVSSQFNPLPHMPILNSSNSAANKDIMSKIWTNGDTVI